MFVAGLQTLRVGFDDCASPAKTTWEDVTAPTTPVATPTRSSNRTKTATVAVRFAVGHKDESFSPLPTTTAEQTDKPWETGRLVRALHQPRR